MAEEIGMTEEEIRNQPHISFRLAHHLFHIHHHGKVIYVKKTMALLEEGKATLRQMKDKAPMNIRLGYSGRAAAQQL